MARTRHASALSVVILLLSPQLVGCGSDPSPSSEPALTAGRDGNGNVGGSAAGSDRGGAGAGIAGALGMSGSGAGAGAGGAGAGTPGAGAGGVGQAARGGAGPAGTSGSGGSAGAEQGPKTVLFDGGSIADLELAFEDPFPWTLVDGVIEVKPGAGPLISSPIFGDMRLHVEFWIPSTPTTNEEQDRGNSGVYLQSRYELQVLDSFNHPLEGTNDCGAFYSIADAASNAALPPETWQTYDIAFRQARWSGDAKVKNARVTVVWNGVVVHQDLELTHATGGGHDEGPDPGRIMFQDHAHRVRYRNIYVQPLPE